MFYNECFGLLFLFQLLFILPMLFNIPVRMSAWLYLLPKVKNIEAHIDRHNNLVKLIHCLVYYYFVGVVYFIFMVVKCTHWDELRVKLAAIGVLIYFYGFYASGIFNGLSFYIVCYITIPALAALVVFLVPYIMEDIFW